MLHLSPPSIFLHLHIKKQKHREVVTCPKWHSEEVLETGSSSCIGTFMHFPVYAYIHPEGIKIIPRVQRPKPFHVMSLVSTGAASE